MRVSHLFVVVSGFGAGRRGPAPPHGNPRILRGVITQLVDQVDIRQQRGDVRELVE